MNPFRILVADDNEDHRFFILRALRQVIDVSLELDEVVDGAEAIDYLQRRGPYVDRPRPHLMLLDLRMPRLDGHEVLAAVRADPGLRTLPVVVLSSSEREEDVADTYRLGANSYVTKRSLPETFAAAVGQLTRYWTEVARVPAPSA